MIRNVETDALESFDFVHLLENVPELKRMKLSISVIQFNPPMDSSEMSPEKWSEIAHIIKANYTYFDGFVILHGTDTMAYTASALSFIIKNLTKPIVFTGSQLPIDTLRTDGKENLITAIEIAASYNSNNKPIVPEVTILFENYLMRANRACKINAEHFSAFRSFNYPVLAQAGVDIKYNDYFILNSNDSEPLQIYDSFDNNVVVLKLFPGINASTVKSVLNIPNLKGVVMETYGSGNALTVGWFIDLIRDAINRGIVILNVSQCQGGSVKMGRYQTSNQLLDAGVISGYDSTTEAALTKMMFLFAQYKNIEQVKNLLNTSIAGEITI